MSFLSSRGGFLLLLSRHGHNMNEDPQHSHIYFLYPLVLELKVTGVSWNDRIDWNDPKITAALYVTPKQHVRMNTWKNVAYQLTHWILFWQSTRSSVFLHCWEAPPGVITAAEHGFVLVQVVTLLRVYNASETNLHCTWCEPAHLLVWFGLEVYRINKSDITVM